jgi:hypothetical protein
MRVEPKASGALFLDQLEVMREVVGKDVVEEALRTLPPKTREEFAQVMPMSWMRVALAEEVVHSIAKAAGRDPLQLHSQVVRIGVEKTFRTLWRLILRFTTDAALVQRTPLIYSKTFDRGELISKMAAPGRSELHLRGWPDISEMQIRGLAMGIESVLRVAGRQDVKVSWDRTSEGAFMVARWRV